MKIVYFGLDHEVAVLETERSNFVALIDEAMRLQVREDRIRIFLDRFKLIDGERDALKFAKQAIFLIVQAVASSDFRSIETPDATGEDNVLAFKNDINTSYGMSLTQSEEDTSLMFFEDEARFNACMRTAVVVNLLDATGEIFEDG